ncbi:MAG TPA: FAD-dependent oxidoreductase [Longimicrobiales bacterium]|nr:FAD-dependent oxidoreductase [Longimicrobiales bacterium]
MTGDGAPAEVDRSVAGPGASGGGGGAPDGAEGAAMDRRRFLGVAGAGAGALALGGGTAGRPAPVDAPWRSAPAIRTQQAPEVLIVGAGAFGAWTALHLQRRGVQVTLVDQHGPGNSRATSGGETRGVRSSYGDRPHGPIWTRWAVESMRRWKEFDEQAGDGLAPLYYTTGDIILREEMDPYLERTTSQWDALGVPYEWMDVEEVRRRWPILSTEGMTRALYEPGAGVVRSRRAIEAVAQEFRRLGGEIRIARITPGDSAGGRLQGLVTDDGKTLTAGTYVFACGPWLPKVLPEVMGQRLRISIGHVYYFGPPPGDHRFEYPNMPSFGIPGSTGWPALPPDFRGFRVRTGGRPPEDPDESSRAEIPPEAIERIREYIARWFPLLAEAPILETRACHYESSTDRNFIVDLHPGLENAWITGGGSAEAFKQGPLLGDYIAHRLVGMDMDPEATEGFRLDEEVFDDDRGWDGEP